MDFTHPAQAQILTLHAMLSALDAQLATVRGGTVAGAEIRKARGKIADAMRDLERAAALATGNV